VVVAFEAGKGLLVLPEGSLVGKGTAARPVVFTGKSQTQGYWKGLWVYSNGSANELEYATVAYGGSQDLPGRPGTKANLVLADAYAGGATLKVTHSRFIHGGGYGLHVLGNARLTGFADNVFAYNAGPALFVPAGQVHRLDAASRFTGSNGWDGVETRGTLNEPGEVTWPAFTDGSPYRVTGFITVTTGLSLAEGVVLRFVAGSTLDVVNQGFLHTHGTAGKPVVFTAAIPTAGNYWGGIFIDTRSARNQLHYARVAYASGKDRPGYLDAHANVQVSNTGTLSLRNATLEHGTGWGVVAYTDQGAQLNADAATVNQFSNLTRGNLKLTAAAPAPLAGLWLDEASFYQGHAFTDQFYNRATGRWFNGAPSPWTMQPAGGFGLRIEADGRFTWTIAEHGPGAGCGNPYSAEYILGRVTASGNQLAFVESYWRSRFYNPCDPSQNADTEVTPGTTTLRYEIRRETDAAGISYWALVLTNPDNTSFKYYRGL
jgi:hypothetical protein